MVNNLAVSRRPDGSWLFTWDAGTGPYSVWFEGRVLQDTTDTFYVAAIPHHETSPPGLEVLDVGEDSEEETYPPYVEIQWRALAVGAVAYIVQQWTGSEWINLTTIMHDPKRGYVSWRSGALVDGADYLFRVLAASLRSVTTTPIEVLITICRNPPPPPVQIEAVGSDIEVSAV